MRNIFDQYEHLENRVTHALATALSEDRRLLGSFLVDVAGIRPPARTKLFLEEQGIPGDPDLTEQEAEGRGLPDAWVHDGDSWAVLIESKVTAPVRTAQLRRHLATAARRGFNEAWLLVITAMPHRRRLPESAQNVLWRDVYTWLRSKENNSMWAGRVADYFEILEARMAEQQVPFEGSLTQFSGFPFSQERPYNYGEAKRVLRLALEELRVRRDLKRLGVDPRGEGRPAITGRGAHSVWDFLRLRSARGAQQFTKYPHLTLALEADRVLTQVTIPNGLARPLKKRLLALSREDFSHVLVKTERNLRPVVRRAPGSAPWFIGIQRHYHYQRSPVVDAKIDFDLRTIAGTQEQAKNPVKPQPVLLEAAYQVLQNRKPNYQMAVGLIMPYRRCAAAREPRALDLVAQTWIACKPVLDAVLGS